MRQRMTFMAYFSDGQRDLRGEEPPSASDQASETLKNLKRNPRHFDKLCTANFASN
jgi:hypothetical protein